MRSLMPALYKSKNIAITFSGGSSSKPFSALVANMVYCYDFLEKTQCLPLYQYDENGNQIENITDWGFNQFVKKYGKKGMTKEAIFYYVYAVLHNPKYRSKYELNLKRDFPRIPFYTDFQKWSAWGKKLMDLHIDYEQVEPYPLEENTNSNLSNPKTKLKAEKEAGKIILDDATCLLGIPPEVWEYKLGNRSALEWVLDQYKEKKISDTTIAEKFDTYKFADYKNQVINLLKRLCTVSLETIKITEEMSKIDE